MSRSADRLWPEHGLISDHLRGADRGPHAAARGEDSGLELRDDAALEGAVAEHPVGVVDGDVLDHGALHQHAGDVADEDDPLGSEPDRERGCGLVGVDVERSDRARADGKRRDHGDAACSERLLDRGRAPTAVGSPTSPSASTCVACSPIASPKSGSASGPIAAQTSRVDLGEGAAHDVQHLGRRHAAPLDEGGRDPAALHLGRDLRAGSVHDDDVVPLLPQRERLAAAAAATRPPSLITTRLTSCTPR